MLAEAALQSAPDETCERGLTSPIANTGSKALILVVSGSTQVHVAETEPEGPARCHAVTFVHGLHLHRHLLSHPPPRFP